ncbi:MAG: LytTR family DNA-binding domain-containing protein [Bacteroidales bacterium]|nr:LytTR family DNA-binding domain-containing protein [Bacteroidales bacterium]
MGKINAIIVDDEVRAIDLFKGLLEEFNVINLVATAENVDDGVQLILDHRPDIVFLDIQMPNKNGFELLHEIKDFDVQPTIIFVTAYDEYAIEAIRHSAFDYLTKPVDPRLLKKAIRRFQCEKSKLNGKDNIKLVLNHLTPNKIKFNSRSGSIFLSPEDILYVEAEGNYAEIFLTNENSHMVSMYLATVLEKLPENMFFRISRSVAINLSYLKQLNRKKKICELEVDGKFFEFNMPAKYIRLLDNKL